MSWQFESLLENTGFKLLEYESKYLAIMDFFTLSRFFQF